MAFTLSAPLGCGGGPPVEEEVCQAIGPSGGTVVSHDGALTLSLRPSSFVGQNEICIRPAVRPPEGPPLAFDQAYRVTPDIPLEFALSAAYQGRLPGDTSMIAVGVIHREDFELGEEHWIPLPVVRLELDNQLVSGTDDRLSMYYALLDNAGSGETDSGGSATDSAGATDTDPTAASSPTAPTDPTAPTATNPTAGMAACDNTVVEAAEVCFGPAMSFAAGNGPTDVVAGDFDGDGNMDVATANGSGDDVSVLLGDGGGSLGGATQIEVGSAPTRVVSAEFSGDQAWDLVVANQGDNSVTVLVADGRGGFTASELAVGTNPSDLALGDLDDDGVPDLAVANAGDGNYQTATNDGSGSMTLLGPWAVGDVTAVRGVAIGLVAAGPSADTVFGGDGTVGASPGNGDGTPMDSTVVTTPFGTALRRFDTGAANGDADVDIAAVDADMAVVLLGGATATFNGSSFGPHPETSEALLADVTGEGDDDLVVSVAGDDTVVIYPGDGTGAFGTAVAFDVGARPSGVAVADLNGDTVGDIIVSNEDDDNVSVLLSSP